MPKVFIEGEDGEVKAKIAFDLNRLDVRIGRGEDNDLIIEHDSSISTNHAVIRRVFGGHVIVDLDSRNGIIVDGEKTPRAVLKHEIGLNIGDAPMTFTYLDDEAELLSKEKQDFDQYATEETILDLEDQRYADQDEDSSIIGRPKKEEPNKKKKNKVAPKLSRATATGATRAIPTTPRSYEVKKSNPLLALIGVLIVFALGLFGGLYLKHQLTYQSGLLQDLETGKTQFLQSE